MHESWFHDFRGWFHYVSLNVGCTLMFLTGSMIFRDYVLISPSIDDLMQSRHSHCRTGHDLPNTPEGCVSRAWEGYQGGVPHHVFNEQKHMTCCYCMLLLSIAESPSIASWLVVLNLSWREGLLIHVAFSYVFFPYFSCPVACMEMCSKY